MSEKTRFDVVVLGAGPGGSASAFYLAESGASVLVLEKHEFPRFQIGESLIPVCVPVLKELGIEPKDSCFVYKRGARFVDEDRGEARVFDFASTLEGTHPHAYQVERAGFDAALANRAAQRGAVLRFGESARRVEFSERGVAIQTRERTYEARYLIDATGQNRLLARQFDSAAPIGDFGQTAIFSHFDQISSEVMEELGPENDIRVMITKNGWGWIIPLPGRRLSIGLVRKTRAEAKDFELWLTESPLISRYVRGARRCETKTVRNFSFRNTKAFGARYACVGDSACFLDPVFSSGVSLALVSAQRICKVVGPALQENREGERDLLSQVSTELVRGYDAFAAIIQRFYDTRFIDHFVFGRLKDESIEREITTMLAGEVWRDDNTLQNAMLASRKSIRVPRSVAFDPTKTERKSEPTRSDETERQSEPPRLGATPS